VYAQATPGNVFPRIIDMPGYVLFLAEPSDPNSNPASLGFLSRRSDQDGEWDTPVNSMAYNSWNHAAVVYDSSSTSNNADLYINGVKQTISKISSPQGTQTANEGAGIIGNRIPLNRGWEGLIDELRVYNRALSASEIVSLYDQGNSGPFNFSLANSMSLSAIQGSSATNTITASLVSGSPEPVSLSASVLPSGASASFSQKTCSPTCSSLLTIATAASTPAGSYTITVIGAGGGVTRTTNFALAVNTDSTSPPPSGSTSTVATPTITPNGGSFTGSVSVTPAQLTLTWQDNSNDEDNFAIERKTGTTGTYSQITLTATNTISYADTSVTSGVTYCYRVQAVNSAGASAYTNEACATVP
jgi:hypothetical protein